jgi:hypothetical protein
MFFAIFLTRFLRQNIKILLYDRIPGKQLRVFVGTGGRKE